MNMQNKSNENVEKKKEKSAVKKIRKSEYLKSLMELKHQEYILEKGLANLINNIKLDDNIIKSLSKEEKELPDKRKNELSTLHKTIFDISNEVKTVKSIISDPEKIQQLETNEFKSKLIGILNKFDDLKKTRPLRTLYEEGNKLDYDLIKLSSLLRKYNSMNNTIESSTIDLFSLNNDIKKNYKDDDDYEDIDDYHTLITKTGYTQRWSNEDHLLFLKIRKKCKNVPSLVKTIRTKCPDLTIEMIINHETWYKLYLELREKQKLKIKEWRKRKELNKIGKLENVVEIIGKENIKNENRKNKNLLKDKDERTNDKIIDKSVDKKELIKKWKLEKEHKRMIEDEESKLRLKSKRALDEKRARVRMEYVKKSLENYEKKKLMEEFKDDTRKELKNVKEYDPTLIKEFRKQDEEYIKKRKLQLSRTNNKIRQNKLFTSPKYKSNKNPSTLFKDTKSWREKCKIKDFNTKDNQNPKLRYIKDLPRLRTRWRNEESIDLQNYFSL